jgi:hypothetical protein
MAAAHPRHRIRPRSITCCCTHGGNDVRCSHARCSLHPCTAPLINDWPNLNPVCCFNACDLAAAWLVVVAAHPRALFQTQGRRLLLLSWRQWHIACVFPLPHKQTDNTVYIHIKLTHQQCMCCSPINELAAAWLAVLAGHPRAPCHTQEPHLLLLSWRQWHV